MAATSTSEASASAISGYWTLTATRCPPGSTARWTWPIEAAAAASCSKSSNSDSSGSSHSDASTRRTRVQLMGGAASRSSASLSW